MREVKLPSGAVLRAAPADFQTSKALYQAVLEEVRSINIDPKMESVLVLKDILCIGFSSKKIEACLWECFKRCTYNSNLPGGADLKIDKDTFEPVAARDDYMTVCMEVTKENVLPFWKSLYAEFSPLWEKLKSGPE